MRTRYSWLGIVGGLFASCSSTNTAIDYSPAMLALRVDVHTLARDLVRGKLEEARGPAQRIARFDTPTPPDRSPEWPAAFASLRAKGKALDDALARFDERAARDHLSDLIASCTDCHTRLRPGAGTKIEIEFEP